MSAGKVFHGKAYTRQKNEKYYTPAWVTEILLRALPLSGQAVLEPAAGNGEIVKVLKAAGCHVVAEDINPDDTTGWGFTIAQGNFLTRPNIIVPIIATNPPFGPGGRLAFQFCWHALRLTERHRGKVAMLMRDDFDSAGGRRLLFKDHPAWHQKIVILERIRWTNLEQKKAGPSGAHAWFIWDWAREPGPAIVTYEGRQP